ncbi:hypothetical protein IMPJCBKJ_00504 [Pseudoalteromonas sp. MB47]|nr:hypothetical protein [Pseudoalteromonas sp. MB47]
MQTLIIIINKQNVTEYYYDEGCYEHFTINGSYTG